MDLIRASVVVEEEDRISNLPHDVIHHILSFLDMKYAVQTCTLSHKWEHIWTSMPDLNLNSRLFPTLLHFAKFVKHALPHRNTHAEVSAVDLTFTGTAEHFFIKSIVNYAYLHNVRQLNIIWHTRQNYSFPQYLFSSHTLKHLTIVVDDPYPYFSGLFGTCKIPESSWDFPALETLNLTGMRLGDGDGNNNLNLFSKCVNLKDLTLHKCSMYYFMETFNVCAPQLFNLTITDPCAFPKVFNLFAPKLENLTASINALGGCSSIDFLQFSVEKFSFLEKVNLFFSYKRNYKKEEIHISQLVDLFQKLSSAKYLILDVDIIETLSSCLDQLSLEPCPFNNLKCLKIDATHLKQNDCMPTVPTQVKNYLLENSTNATFVMDLPQVSWKRSQELVHNEQTTAKKVAKLEEKIQMQDKVIADQKTKIQMLEAEKLQHKKIMAELKMLIESGSPDRL